jgi:hypothetical protein
MLNTSVVHAVFLPFTVLFWSCLEAHMIKQQHSSCQRHSNLADLCARMSTRVKIYWVVDLTSVHFLPPTSYHSTFQYIKYQNHSVALVPTFSRKCNAWCLLMLLCAAGGQLELLETYNPLRKWKLGINKNWRKQTKNIWKENIWPDQWKW